MDISELRSGIDAIDQLLCDLFLQRMALSAQIGAYKKERALPIHVPQREEEIIAELSQKATTELAPYVGRLYGQIFALSREYQESLNG